MKTQDKPGKWESVRNSTWWEYIQVFAVAFVLVFGFMRPFVVEAFKIPSASMEDTLLIGDRILVTKFIYGIKIPFTDVRILDFHKPAIGDIFVFKPPPAYGRTQNFIKRLTGLPGDIMEMKNGKLYRNGEAIVDTNHIKRLLFPIDLELQRDLDDENISQSLRRAFRNRQNPLSENAVISTQEKGSRWTIIDGDEGKTYFLRKDVVDRRSKIYRLHVYVNEESYFRQPSLMRRTSLNRILNKPGPYKVPEGHVFAMGDNRDMSNDSRAWGPVPIEDIKGQAFLKYWSRDQERNWRRIGDWPYIIRFSRIGRPVR